jgi:hypothetical protein
VSCTASVAGVIAPSARPHSGRRAATPRRRAHLAATRRVCTASSAGVAAATAWAWGLGVGWGGVGWGGVGWGGVGWGGVGWGGVGWGGVGWGVKAGLCGGQARASPRWRQAGRRAAAAARGSGKRARQRAHLPSVEPQHAPQPLEPLPQHARPQPDEHWAARRERGGGVGGAAHDVPQRGEALGHLRVGGRARGRRGGSTVGGKQAARSTPSLRCRLQSPLPPCRQGSTHLAEGGQHKGRARQPAGDRGVAVARRELLQRGQLLGGGGGRGRPGCGRGTHAPLPTKAAAGEQGGGRAAVRPPGALARCARGAAPAG